MCQSRLLPREIHKIYFCVVCWKGMKKRDGTQHSAETTKMSIESSPEIRYTSLNANKYLSKLKKWAMKIKDGAIQGMRAVGNMQHYEYSLFMQIPMRNTT